MIRIKCKLNKEYRSSFVSASWLNSLLAIVSKRICESGMFKTNEGTAKVCSCLKKGADMHIQKRHTFEVVVNMRRGKSIFSGCEKYKAYVKYDPEVDEFSIDSEIFDCEHMSILRDEARKFVDDLAEKINAGCYPDGFANAVCPICKGKLEIDYFKDGKKFFIWCAVDKNHVKGEYPVNKLPSWWKKHTGKVSIIHDAMA